MVKHLTERASRESLANLVSIAGRPADPRLPAKVDLVLMVNVFHHIAGREEYFRRLRGSLRAGGRVAIIDFKADSERGPPKRERISPERVKAEMGEAGYAAVKEHAFLPSQYFLVFEPKGK
jgi:SAM-dependent methyltransferase